MNVCAIRQIRVPPELLPSMLELIEPIIDFGPLLAFQDPEALSYLLEAAEMEAVSSQRQAYAGLLSAEMAVLHGVDPAQVRRLLRILEQAHLMNPESTALLGSAFALLDLPEADRPPAKDLISQARIIDLLPDEPPPVVIGDGGTVRRPVPKIGRNAPCPFGSGKKYKKCCMGKDQQRIRDASSHEGLTRSAWRLLKDRATRFRNAGGAHAHGPAKSDHRCPCLPAAFHAPHGNFTEPFAFRALPSPRVGYRPRALPAYVM
jgi:SEC-C motif